MAAFADVGRRGIVDPERHSVTSIVPIAYVAALVVAILAAALVLLATQARGTGSKSKRELLRRPERASAILQPFAVGQAPKKARRARSGIASCFRPGPTNTVANCKSDGLPAVEPSVAANSELVVASAADYNSYNGQPQFGFYWSHDGRRWSDGGPLDIFPHSDSNAGGDPLIAIDGRGVVYYAGMFFSYTRCEVGGVELLRRDPGTGRWSRTELAANGKHVLQDRPGFAVEGRTVFYAWAVFDSCEGDQVQSRLKVALLPAGAASAPPRRVLDVPGSRYSQGAAPAGDGRGGFWLAWEEYPDAVANSGSIKLAHWSLKGGWDEPRTISPPGFRDLPEPLPGFRLDTSSVPAIAVSKGVPHVVWASADSGRGRITLWTPEGLETLHDTGGDQLLPAVTADRRGDVIVSFSQADAGSGRMDRLLWHAGRVRIISSAPSYPRAERFFDGRFVGWVSGLTQFRERPLAVWPDIRRGSRGAVSAMTAVS
jgi:hypothetical protein